MESALNTPTIHSYLFLCIALIITVSLLVMLGQKLRISYPIFLVLGGLLISFIPGIPNIKINPELIFLIFLPPLLYDAAWNTSWKDFWRWRRVISVLAFGLVIVTSVVVAFVSSSLIPGFTLSLGFLLGGIISPPDAVAATSVLKGIKVPRRVVAILEGESLINDASSLIVFRFALVAVIAGTFVWHQAIVDFSLVTFMGIVVGLVIALVLYAVLRWLPTTPSIDTALSFTAPYLMYLTAEHFHVSGVMAVVSGGLFISYRSHELFSHSSRLQSVSMWSTTTFVLNGLVFMLIGLELPTIMEGLEGYSLGEAIGYSLIIAVAIIITRIGFALFASMFTVFISRFITVADDRPGWQGPLIIGWAGMRGVVSLAAALSIPLLMSNGDPFPHRNLILFITFVVIFITLVVQGLSFPLIIRWIKYQDPDHVLPAKKQDEQIQLQLLKVALEKLIKKYPGESVDNALVANLKTRYENESGLIANHSGTAEPETEKETVDEFRKVFAELIKVQRRELMKFRTQEGFEDEIIRKHENQLDLEEEKVKHKFEAFE
ncbi:Na+/H+ antiporter [Chryseosolibacter histidini]|uniref:Na+/H+ antiporter n=1 Tax=Chryseosolibacter histidini TaxID=2782349 RepID=UPI0020B39F24|nr:Na+/H+ antiporter [Chryseosolibacter histidini]